MGKIDFMEILTYLFFALFYFSAFTLLMKYNLGKPLHPYYFKGYDIIKISFILILLVLPVILLYKNFSLFMAIVSHILYGLLLGSIVVLSNSKIISEKMSWINTLLLLALSIISLCLIKPYRIKDGTYCASVHYYNPETVTEKNYRLNVVIDDNSIIKIMFRSGGYLDESHFEKAEVDDNRKAVVVDDKEREFTINVLDKGECDY